MRSGTPWNEHAVLRNGINSLSGGTYLIHPKMSEVSRSSMRSERLTPVSDILPRISAMVIATIIQHIVHGEETAKEKEKNSQYSLNCSLIDADFTKGTAEQLQSPYSYTIH